MNAPGFDVKEAQKAMEATGLVIDGSVCAGHWGVRHTDPDESVRAKALETLTGALTDTHAVGGDTVLLVTGHGKDGSKDEIWERSISNIRKALPLAAKLGVSIAIENVWNHKCYDHDGDETQTAEEYCRYVDAFESPFVGMQFDIGNHWKYGNTGDWIRTLGTRIHKLDVKGFSREEGRFTGIGEGDLDFPDVCLALEEIGFHGWCAAEVGGGDEARLKEVSDRMDRVFQLT
jgi:hexulose-6-phosphate isomerase